ncbi:hypothetical protein Ato02nite_018870 [Paractinoplanes toevensis]|uniref:Uncharacterized protein n=1 Tax=Paractinoplanes toevensis TaxID=571911 RepID=A0A919W177_9ACTN|nr:hypothetical protein Ato02nite_018870 [Actinoplanes toevensis]
MLDRAFPVLRWDCLGSPNVGQNLNHAGTKSGSLDRWGYFRPSEWAMGERQNHPIRTRQLQVLLLSFADGGWGVIQDGAN